MSVEDEQGSLRIGALSRRVGVSDHVLRAWERRYGLLEPVRSPAGYRLYTRTDENRVRRVQTLIAEGLSVAEAARIALAEPAAADRDHDVPRRPDGRHDLTVPAPGDPSVLRGRLSAAFARLDEAAAQEVLDELFTHRSVEDAVRDVVMPYLRDLGDAWRRGDATVAQEHLASQVLRGRLAALGHGMTGRTGHRALLACPPGERHDLALLAFGLVLRRRGWSVSFLGADTPVGTVIDAVGRVRPDVVILAATDSARFAAVQDELADLAASIPLYLAGPGGTEALARRVGGTLLPGDPVTSAQTLTV